MFIPPCFSGFADFGGLGVDGEATARFSAAVVASGDWVFSVSVGRSVRFRLSESLLYHAFISGTLFVALVLS